MSFLRKVAHNKAYDLNEQKQKLLFLPPMDLQAAINKAMTQAPVPPDGEPTVTPAAPRLGH